MLAFIDESGQPHSNDRNAYSTLVALCMDEADHRELSRQLFGAKKALLGRDDSYELKAVKVLNERTFSRQRAKWELVEQCFALFDRIDLTTFVIVMPRPSQAPDIRPDWLPHQHIFLLQRINALARERNEPAILVYDGQGMNIQGRNLSACISNYIFRVAMPDRQMEHVLDTAFFVDSRVTPGIQVADMAAGALRLRAQHDLDGDDGEFASAIRRCASAVAKSTRSDLTSDKGVQLDGIMRLREGWHYERRGNEAVPEPDSISESSRIDTPSVPGNANDSA